MPKQNITFALFDVRPIDPETKRVNFEFINGLKSVVNLNTSNKVEPQEVKNDSAALSVKIATKTNTKEKVLQELQATISESTDLNREVGLVGGKLVSSKVHLPKEILPRSGHLDDGVYKFRKEFSKIFSTSSVEVPRSRGMNLLSPPPYLPWAPEIPPHSGKESQAVIDLSPAGKELDTVLTNFLGGRSDSFKSEAIGVPYKVVEEKASKFITYFALSIAVAFGLTFLLVESLNLKNNILQRSNQAYLNLNSIQDNLSEFNFFEAASSFTLAAKNFELMYEDLKKVSLFFKVLDKVTLGSVSDVSNLVEAGELISQAGLDLYNALGKISEVNLISAIQPGSQTDILKILRQFRLDLIRASRNLNQATTLISGSDSSLIPESERKKFDEFKARLPEFSNFIEKAIDYSDVLAVILGQSNPQKYIFLFQNSSELRPTGGFPGSYALVEFDKGVMKKFMVDDIYNPDGQMKEKIIPPRPLQKITPNWGMRDANWFIDFQTSARKIAEFYYKDVGILVDGVLALNVDLIPEILKITGPLEMPEFGLALNSDNFIFEVQKEVEYERTKGESQPKQILVEFAPKLLERLSGLDNEGWIKVFALLVSGVEKKDILAYFVDSRLQNFALANSFAGEIKETDSDYLMITHSNIMGSKTDAVIDNLASLGLEKDEENHLIHTLEIKRSHNGGDLGFYNKRNNDYVRVLLPEEAELISVSGNDVFEINPLLDYRQNGFISDPDLERYESKIKRIGGIEILEEGGKKVFAFWMIIESGQTKTVKIKYRTPEFNQIYVQKQPGLKSEFKLIFENNILFDGSHSFDKNITLE